MADYLNPAAFMPNADFRVNPLQGFLAGQAAGNMEQLMDRAYRDQDLGYLSSLNDYNMKVAENPAKMAEFGARESEATNRKTIANNPLSVDAPLSDLSTKIDTNEATKVNNQNAIRLAQANFLNDAGNRLDAGAIDMNRGAQDPQNISAWRDIVQQAQKVGITGLDPLPSQAQLDLIQNKAGAARKSLPHLEKLEEIRQQGANQMDITREQGKQRLDQISAQGGIENMLLHSRPGAALEEATRAYANGTATRDQKALVDMSYMVKSLAAIMQSSGMQLGNIGNAGNPAAIGSNARTAVQSLLQPGGPAPAPTIPAPPSIIGQGQPKAAPVYSNQQDLQSAVNSGQIQDGQEVPYNGKIYIYDAKTHKLVPKKK